MLIRLKYLSFCERISEADGSQTREIRKEMTSAVKRLRDFKKIAKALGLIH